MIIAVENLKETLARNLSRLIDSSNLTVKEIAKEIGVTDVSVHRWKSGANPPDVGHMDKLAKILRVDPMEFYRSEGNIVSMSPSRALKKYLVIPDDVVEELCQFDSSSDVWEMIKGVIDGVKNAEKQLKG